MSVRWGQAFCRNISSLSKSLFAPAAPSISSGMIPRGTRFYRSVSICHVAISKGPRLNPSASSPIALRRHASPLGYSVFSLPRVEPLAVCRGFSSTIITVLTPPAVFLGLLLALWAYKCLMMVIFQNKIIYMPSVPPFSRREEISHNASSLPPRLPLLSSVVRSASKDQTIDLTIVALSYRGFWKSGGKPSQKGIEQDALSALRYVSELCEALEQETKLVVWGQSVGAGVATDVAARASSGATAANNMRHIDGVILETAFTNIADMLTSLYPQRWLPYRYLVPFLRNWWDSKAALIRLSKTEQSKPKFLMLSAENDELVPADHGPILDNICKDCGFDTEHHVIPTALHNDVMQRREGVQATVRFLKEFAGKLG
ncbi:MAG: hypothetical protein M1831_001743 [Alyxoria varia]|nr:MAG: hypothetical protein M1831_001743 [Alyxoria varia]